jgi:hypothetical protein
MRNITLSADEHLIAAARKRAAVEHTTLNEQFRLWLAEYGRKQQQLRFYDDTIKELQGKLKVGGKLSRAEINER